MTGTLHGLGVSAGEGVGPVARLAPAPSLPAEMPEVTDHDGEAALAADALAQVASELERRAAEVDGAAREVLTAQAMIARDPVLADAIRARVGNGSPATHALAEAFAEHRQMLESLGGYLGERAADLDDICGRALAVLLGLPMPGIPEPGHPLVLVAGDLAPADTAVLDPGTVLAIVTERGGPTGHTAILAKQLAIPAVTACEAASTLRDGDVVLVDGSSGEVIVEPGEQLIAEAERRRRETERRRRRSTGPGRTADGHAIPLLVNIGGPGGLEAAAAAGEGVGLLRTEFLFLDRTTAPSVAEQRDAYVRIFKAFAGRRVVVRTLDVGADKPLPYLSHRDEPNPALGIRGLRLARGAPDLLETQLRAVAEAATDSDADVWVMAPMVATGQEAEEFADAAKDHGIAKAGVMIEVPSAAVMAEDVLSRVDFASIGTNDLAQYTLAADRLAGELAELLDPWQPALLRLIEAAGRAGTELDRPVGVCGEAASDPTLAPVLVGLGVTSLSMAPASVADVRAALADLRYEDCRDRARLARDAPTAMAAREAVMRAAPSPVPS